MTVADGFLTSEWVDSARRALDGFEAPWSGGQATAVFAHPDGPWHRQVWVEGVLDGWEVISPSTQSVGNADCVIRCSAAHLWTYLSEGVAAGDALQVEDRRGCRWALPPTADELALVCSSRRVPGLDLRLDLSIPDLPEGPRQIRYRFEDGLPNASTPVPATDDDHGVDDADIAVRIAMPMLGLRYLSGEIPLRNLMDLVEVDGDPLDVLLLTGLLAPPDPGVAALAFREAVRSATTVWQSLEFARPRLAPLLALEGTTS